MIDIHSHILPNIDDGCKSIEESLELLKLAEKNGVSDVILTPHFMFGTEYNKENEEKKKRFLELQKKVEEEKIQVHLYLGNEVFVEYNMIKYVKEDKILTLNGSRYLLFELPRFEIFHGVLDEVFSLETEGLVPILAHPERYEMIINHPNYALTLKERGVLFQSNLGSFLGLYGKSVQETAILLLKHQCIDFIASDVHTPHHCHYQKIKEVKEMLKKYISEREIETLFVQNPQKVLRNEDLEGREPVPFKKKLFGKWK